MRPCFISAATVGIAALAAPLPPTLTPSNTTYHSLTVSPSPSPSPLVSAIRGPDAQTATNTVSVPKSHPRLKERFGWLIKKSVSDYTLADLEADLATRRVAGIWPESWFLKRDDEPLGDDAVPLAEHLTLLEKKDPEAFGWLIKRDPEPFGWLIKRDPEAFGWLIKKDPEAFGWLIKKDPEAFGWLIKRDPEAFGWLIKRDPEAFGWLIKRDPEAFGWLIKREPEAFDSLSKRDPEAFGWLIKKDPQPFGWLIKRSAEAFGWLIKKDTDAPANQERDPEAKQLLRLPGFASDSPEETDETETP